MRAPRPGKVAAYRVLGDRGYRALQARYWRWRVTSLRYPFEFREEIEAAVSAGDTVLDIGANVGQYTALLARLVGPSGRVLAFEPDPRTYGILESIVRRVALSNVETFQVALTDTAGTVPIVRVLDEDGLPNMGLTHLASRGEASSVDARADLLDSLCSEVEACSFVKIDAEGSELAVLRGGARFMSTRRPLLLVELDDVMSARYGSSPQQVIAFLAGLGYELWKPQASEWRGRSALFRPA
jgi:FkbM family methyltransferase